MALDGAFLKHLKKEIEETALGSRVDKIYQPNKDELIFFLRTKNYVKKLLISSRGTSSARIHFTEHVPENPKVPPMLCMLFRKKLGGAKLVGLRQASLERVLLLDFDAKNELSEPVILTLAVEIMGKYSNVILIDSDGNIIDALKRVGPEMSSKRLILPGIKYNVPPAQNKISVLDTNEFEIINKIENSLNDVYLSKLLLKSIQGISPVVCREIEYLVFGYIDVPDKNLSNLELKKLNEVLSNLISTIKNVTGEPFMVYDKNKKPLEFSFMNISQYENLGKVIKMDTFSELLDEFYNERDKIDRMRVKSLDLTKILHTISDRISRKIVIQKSEADKCSDFNEFKVFADLINANLYNIKSGADFVELSNFYDNNLSTVKIKLDPRLNASQNAQKYYKEYRKAKTAVYVLKEQIENSQKEFEYIASVMDELSRASSEDELDEIRNELYSQGYLKARRKSKISKKLKPIEYLSTDGFKILVGRNNTQNDELTLKMSKKNDIWFHTKDIHGSHTIIVTENKVPPSDTLIQAAILAAYHSKAKESSNVPVDYTEIRNVHKPNGAKPGMVIYEKNNTLYVTPDKSIIEKLKV